MEITEYLKNIFPKEIKKLNFRRIPEEYLEYFSFGWRRDKIYKYRSILYFGGQNWENFHKDILEIDKNNIEYFFICLFTVITIDIGIYTYYRQYYYLFREKTMYPKFGGYRTGFGISLYYENPKKLLQVPESYGLINKENVSKYVDEYVDLFIAECNNFFIDNKIQIEIKEFIVKLLNDEEFRIDANENGSVFVLIYNKLNERINGVRRHVI